MKRTFAEINATMKELAEYTALAADLKVQIESLQDEIKGYMAENGIDEVLAEDGTKAVWREVVSSRFNSTQFKKDFLDIYKAYTTQTSYKRFTFG